jgi:Resolvase, N terminal domain
MPEHNSTVRAVAYYRMSTDRQEDSIAQQRDWTERTCKREGVELVATFEDPGVSGRPSRGKSAVVCERLPAHRAVSSGPRREDAAQDALHGFHRAFPLGDGTSRPNKRRPSTTVSNGRPMTLLRLPRSTRT